MSKRNIRYPDGVFFTGHRPNAFGGWDEKSEMAREVKIWLYQAIERAIKKGRLTFVTGMAIGVDIWAGEAVLALKAKYPHVKLICACPYPSQADRWKDFNKLRWQRLMQDCDEFVVVSNDPPEGSPKFEFAKRLNVRNEFMVDVAPIGIGVLRSDTTKGGTVNCLKYAKKQSRPVLVYDPILKREKWQNKA